MSHLGAGFAMSTSGGPGMAGLGLYDPLNGPFDVETTLLSSFGLALALLMMTTGATLALAPSSRGPAITVTSCLGLP